MSSGFTRTERRQLKRLTAENEPTIEADRRFFERFFWRSHRIRRASQAEVALNALLDKRWRHLPEGAAVLVTHDRRFLEAFGATQTLEL